MKSAIPRSPNLQDNAPYIFVKIFDNDLVKRKKILLPNSIKKLKENCMKVFPDYKCSSLLDKNNYLIESVHDINSGDTIFMSSIDPAFVQVNPSKRPPSPDNSPIYSNSFNCSKVNEVTKQLKKIEHEKKLEKKRRKEEKLLEKKRKQEAMLAKKSVENNSPRSSIQFANQPPSLMGVRSRDFSQYTRGSKKKQSNKTMIDMRKISRPPSSGSDDDDDDDDPKADIVSTSTKLSAFLSQHEEVSDDEESEELKRHREEKRRKQLMYQSCVTIKDEKNLPFQQLIEEIIIPQDAPKLLEEGLDLIPKDRKKFIQGTSDWEGEHIYIWMKGAADQHFLKRYPMQPYHDPITTIVMNFLNSHRFVMHKNYHYRFKAAVVGPKRSGKSTLLGNAVDNYILDLAATGLWKSTFLIAIDIKMISHLLDDYAKFYLSYLELILDAIAKQSPLSRPHMPAIRRQMRSVLENRTPLCGKHPYHDIDAVAMHLSDAYRNPYGFFMWLNHVLMLPITLGKAVGFKDISLFVDNIEYADVILHPHEPFDMKNGQAIVIEHVKFALSQANFILSAEQSEKLFHILPPFDEEGIDLSCIDYITPYNATLDLGSRVRYDYLIECREEAQPVRLSIEMCGGIVPYVAAWDELHHSLFLLERANKRYDDIELLEYNVIADAQTLIDKIFICDKTNKITVIGVKRDKKGSDYLLTFDDSQSNSSRM